MRNKTAAGLLALFLGWAGIHRFYLGQTGYGILYFLFMFIGVSFILGLIDAVVFFGMSEEEFNLKYNSKRGMVPPIYHRRQQQGYAPPHPRSRHKAPAMPKNMTLPQAGLQNPYKTSGIKKYKDFDLEGAIEDFEKGLEIHPKDIALHFNLACAYSLTEQVDKAYTHLDRAVALGFTDYEKIRTHDDLAFVRIQERWDEFQENNFQLPSSATPSPPPETETQNEKPIEDDQLLAQLKRLSELRERGLLSEQEFIIEKKKLTR